MASNPAVRPGWRRFLGRLIPRGLALRVILSLTLIVAVVASVSAYADLKNQERLLLDQMTMSADQLSAAIVNATWHAMLEDRRDAAYGIMESVARQPGIEKVRIFNKEGRIVFSTGADQGGMVDKKAEACDLCHSAEQPRVTVDVTTRSRTFRTPDRRVLGMITPVYNEPSCSNAPCHAHPAEVSVLGVLDLNISLDRVDAERTHLRRQALERAVVEVGLLALLFFFFTRRFIGNPIRRLTGAIRLMGANELGRPIRVDAPAELGELERSFEAMRVRLADAMGELNTLTRDLEQKVQERTSQLDSTREKLAQSERMASLGRLAATVAHEVNNPVAGILNLAKLMLRIVQDDGIPADRVAEVRHYLTLVAAETVRVGRIVSDLLMFSRQSRPVIAPVDLSNLIDSTLAVLSHRLAPGNITVQRELVALPKIPCDAQQVQQVLINLIVNAVAAVQVDATIHVRTRLDVAGQRAAIEVEDFGSGIAPEHLARIFDPFFTTKEHGKALGLGLAVAYGIVQAHGGTIDVSSTPGSGTRFRVWLPLRPATEAPMGEAE